MELKSEIAWSSYIRNVVMLSSTTYQVNLAYENPNEAGAVEQKCSVGYYIKDFVGNTYKIVLINSTSPLQVVVEDILNVQIGPQLDRMGFVYQGVDNGNGEFIAPINYRRLDDSARETSRPIEDEYIWQTKIDKEIAIAFSVAL